MQMIRYHPLIDGDTDGLKRYRCFYQQTRKQYGRTVECTCRRLFPIITGFIKIEPMSQNATDSIEIHCPLCGAVLRQMASKP